MDSRTQQQLIFEAHRKSTGASYLLWFCLGFLGAHRFYLGRTGSGIAQLLMCLSVVGIIPLAFWWLIDAFQIPGMVRDENMKTIRELGGFREPESEARLAAPAPQPSRSFDPRVEEIREMRRR
ncbi:TM2 domain-containing protein [Aurantiacibacter zhengii]|uniref:TM2 domain-containing protein n=1 Tax=Aurantiacibacter zhengii TaxID=2307003 RepID=A0A418NUY6_9SPHN|nr:TM2 domain-containing protein [Aurantiacibacter zhengii]RIV87819.1 TM2 domain-containing protein [Aurantiacibacter zhengii]